MFYYLRHCTTKKLQATFSSAEEIKGYNDLISGNNFFNQPIKNDERRYDNNQEIMADQGDDYTTGFLLDYVYSKNHKLMRIDLSQ